MKLERSSLYKINIHSNIVNMLWLSQLQATVQNIFKFIQKQKTKQNRANMPKLDLNSKQKFIACVDTGLPFLG